MCLADEIIMGVNAKAPNVGQGEHTEKAAAAGRKM